MTAITFEPGAWWSELEVPAGQELVFIGVRLDASDVRRRLDAAQNRNRRVAGAKREGDIRRPYRHIGRVG